MMHYTTTVTTDAQDNYIITIPDQILNYLEWKEGDTLNWQISDSKQIIITKIKNAEESGGEDQESNISEATQEDWEDFWYNSESEGKDYDERYDQYIQETAKETFGQAYHSPEQQGSWS
jgi:bifunctional DNA-binding transcriptional regulator/antitoxin component of YhaV-PrlF toxin-antitoxin module